MGRWILYGLSGWVLFLLCWIKDLSVFNPAKEIGNKHDCGSLLPISPLIVAMVVDAWRLRLLSILQIWDITQEDILICCLLIFDQLVFNA